LKFVHTADTHLGFEITRMAQSDPGGRGRRADSIFRNFRSTVEHALEIEADLFIHSGDFFNKYYIPREILDDLVQPFSELIAAGTRVLLIPGNHERSEFPFDLFHGQPGIFVFDRPGSVCLKVDGYSIGIAGFPFIREYSKRVFFEALQETEYRGLRADLNFLVTHQAFDQAVVGPIGFTFRGTRSDTVLREAVPTDFDYIAAGHIHRYQILEHLLKPRLHFVYPGSVQRMSFAEKDEEKGFVEGELLNGRIETRFLPLPAYEMEMVEIKAAGLSGADCENAIRGQFWRCHEDLVLRLILLVDQDLVITRRWISTG
jgi:DNA repair protein SbcD/Mre11